MLIIPDECQLALKAFREGGNYATDAEADFATMLPHFPERVDSIIDIGCGLAGLDVYLRRHFPKARIMLLDSTEGLPYYYFEHNQRYAKPYGDRAAAEALLLANGVHDIEWLNDGDSLEADLIVSTLAWGFHFPLSTYSPKGFCIADLRKGKEGVKGKVIHESKSYFRCAFQCSQ
jgi:hypothetical protein